MAWSGGTYTRTNGTYSGANVWANDKAANVKIVASRHDTHDQDLAAGINNCLTKDGQNSPTANISWGTFKITNLGNGTAAQDAATYAQTITAVSFDSGTGVVTLTRAAGDLTVDISAFDPDGYVPFTDGRLVLTAAGTTPTSGTGVELYFESGAGYLVPIDRATTTFQAMRVYGSPVYLHHGVDVKAETSSTGVTVTGNLTASASVIDSAGHVRRIPVTTQNSNYTFALSDLGKVVRKDGATAIAYTIDPEGTTAYGDGFIVTARNANAAGNITLTRGSGVSLRLAGSSTDQNVTIAPWGQATLIREASNVWVVTGTGLS